MICGLLTDLAGSFKVKAYVFECPDTLGISIFEQSL